VDRIEDEAVCLPEYLDPLGDLPPFRIWPPADGIVTPSRVARPLATVATTCEPSGSGLPVDRAR